MVCPSCGGEMNHHAEKLVLPTGLGDVVDPVLGGVVWFSTLRERTYALATDTGRLLWTFPDGKYSPVVTDGERLYLVGLGKLYAFTAR